jgi:hypothetical protein
MTGIARFDYGIAGALSSRYTAFSGLILISIIALSASLLSDVRYKKGISNNLVVASFLVLAVPALTYSWLCGLNGIRARSQSFQYIYDCSHQPHPTYDCLYQIYFPSTKIAQDRLDYLKQKHYGGY